MPEIRLERIAHCPQYAIGCRVALCVVDLLELVKVEHGQTEPSLSTVRLTQSLAQFLVPCPAIGEPGERIRSCCVRQFAMRFARLLLKTPELDDLAQQPAGQLKFLGGAADRQ